MYKASSNDCISDMLNTLIVIKQSFKAIDNKLLKKYSEIWKNARNLFNIKFNSEPIYGDNDKYIKANIPLHGDKVNTNFQSKKMPKENIGYKCLSLIMLDSVVRVNKNHYTQTLLEEYKYEIKKTKMENLINDDLEWNSSDNETESDSDNE